jgi:hypothetical protein
MKPWLRTGKMNEQLIAPHSVAPMQGPGGTAPNRGDLYLQIPRSTYRAP